MLYLKAQMCIMHTYVLLNYAWSKVLQLFSCSAVPYSLYLCTLLSVVDSVTSTEMIKYLYYVHF